MRVDHRGRTTGLDEVKAVLRELASPPETQAITATGSASLAPTGVAARVYVQRCRYRGKER